MQGRRFWSRGSTAVLAATTLLLAAAATRAVATATSAVATATGAAAAANQAHAARGCASPQVSAPREATNPLALGDLGGYRDPLRPQDPLHGAHFFVDGPRHGQAAGAVAGLLGINPKRVSADESWATFASRHRAAIARNSKARLLAKIAGQEETQNVSEYAEGGGPGAIFGQTHKLLCDNMRADRHAATVLVLSTLFIYPHGQYCPTAGEIAGWGGTFRRLVGEMARAIGRRRTVILEEIDSIGVSSCLRGAALNMWLSDLSYESGVFGRLPHSLAYMEAGYSDAQGAAWTARRLVQAGISKVRGFFTNDTHFAWSSDEIHWAGRISADIVRMTHGRTHPHFIINTAQNGRGPALNPHPGRQGIENLCNPPGRGLGRVPTGTVHPTFDGRDFKYLDAFLWSGVPGRSHNSNCPNGPWKPGGVFDPRFALELAGNANQKLGPGYPSEPY
jgi:endoglucanase